MEERNNFILREVRINGIHAGYQARIWHGNHLDEFLTPQGPIRLALYFARMLNCVLRGTEIREIGKPIEFSFINSN